jgi:hypothetical protein
LEKERIEADRKRIQRIRQKLRKLVRNGIAAKKISNLKKAKSKLV